MKAGRQRSKNIQTTNRTRDLFDCYLEDLLSDKKEKLKDRRMDSRLFEVILVQCQASAWLRRLAWVGRSPRRRKWPCTFARNSVVGRAWWATLDATSTSLYSLTNFEIKRLSQIGLLQERKCSSRNSKVYLFSSQTSLSSKKTAHSSRFQWCRCCLRNLSCSNSCPLTFSVTTTSLSSSLLLRFNLFG